MELPRSPAAATPARVRVAVIIPALHRPDLSARAVASVHAQGLSQNDYEILVVENAAALGPTLPDPLPARTRRLLLAANLGFTGAATAGIAASASEFILLLNNDAELAPGCLARLLAALESAPRAALAGGKLLSAADRAMLDGAGDALLLAGGAYRLGHGERDSGQFDRLAPLSCCGAALLVRREMLAEIGGLDQQFFAYLDDLDLALRARRCGYAVLFVPGATATHRGSATLGDALHPRMAQWITRNQLLLLIKNYPASLLFRLLPRICFFQALWLLRALGRGHLISWLRGIGGALYLLPAMLRKRRQIQRGARLTSAQLLACLRDSEAQIAAWQQSLPPPRRSRLLAAYFSAFPPQDETRNEKPETRN